MMGTEMTAAWNDAEGSRGTIFAWAGIPRIAIEAKPSMTADDGSVLVGIDAPWLGDLMLEVKEALEGNSNDAEHDALHSVAEAFGVRIEDPYDEDYED